MATRLMVTIVPAVLALAACGGDRGTCTVRFEGIIVRVEQNIGAGDCDNLCVENQTCDWVATSSPSEILHP